MIHFILGGARSGKSCYAEQQTLLQAGNSHQPVYIATATAIDNEMKTRILKHQLDRTSIWELIECPIDLVSCLENASTDKTYLLDCLTLWLNNLLFLEEGKQQVNMVDSSVLEQKLKNEIDLFIAVLRKHFTDTDHNIVIVSNEVGLGVIPMGETTRLFVDHCGWLNQAIAKISQRVTLVTAGIPLTLKS
ncbi:bifunctional adenosylcobinamide kinase/adenosylcobinamide-phosphate guanylyltransferase [Candidatus Colwellia aromaticivorans]|uniref:bifunctional adenosylcobinamide kinase/adenosylcobinamide-phosphate guanylyltransferase n=1 Tax=Candidatus Colwellia aromaticivorans TaxID=2267621 RepID=UPI000DF497E6|nr:bifunctional adenosylcobinamide kinase/adenosylcobinamide-phosphate guanylyltransferase [Candidatus Colwellia aromaticivorans]